MPRQAGGPHAGMGRQQHVGLLQTQCTAERSLKSRNGFLNSVKPANCKTPHRTSGNLDESIASGVSTVYVQLTYASRSSGRNGNTSMETQYVNVVSRQKIPRTCCNASSLHDPAPWITFQSSTIQQSLA